MNPKALLIPIAAFALSATSVSADNTSLLQRAGLSNRQIQAFQIARRVQEDGDKNKARSILENAGIDIAVIESVRDAASQEKLAMEDAIATAIKSNDYQAFKAAISGSPLADIVNTESEFRLFAEAHAHSLS